MFVQTIPKLNRKSNNDTSGVFFNAVISSWVGNLVGVFLCLTKAVDNNFSSIGDFGHKEY